MAINPSFLSVDSEVRKHFLEPLSSVFSQVSARRNWPVASAWDWLTKGVDRVLANGRSGRDFLQSFAPFWEQSMQVGPYFEKLASPRRLAMVAECSALLRARVNAARHSEPSPFAAPDAFEVYAGDGHCLEHATHDPVSGDALADRTFLRAQPEKPEPVSIAAGRSVGAQKGTRCPRAQTSKRGAVATGRRQGSQSDVGLGQGWRQSAVLAGAQSFGRLLPVPVQSRDVPGTGEATGHGSDPADQSRSPGRSRGARPARDLGAGDHA